MFPLKINIDINTIPPQGRFGGARKYDIHTGVDLYCNESENVYAIEDGVIINICDFTGVNAGSPWWNETKAILIKGKSGVILYGEINPIVSNNESVIEGELIGTVKTVLKKDKGLPMNMLHIELYEDDYIGSGEWWIDTKPDKLLNIEKILF